MGDSLGIVHVWSSSYKQLLRLTLLQQPEIMKNPAILSLAVIEEGMKILVGTKFAEIYQLASQELSITVNTKYKSTEVLKATFSPSDSKNGKIGGLAVSKNPSMVDRFYTCADDGFLRIWSIENRKLVEMIEIDTKPASESFKKKDASVKCSTIALSPREDLAAVGLTSGSIKVEVFN